MLVSSLVAVALPALAAAQQQVPLFEQAKGWFDQAASFLKSAAANPAGVASEKVAQAAVTSLNFDDWKSTLQHSRRTQTLNHQEPWMVFMTGGNKTCYGKCGRVDAAWNEAVTYLVADPSAPKLATIDCEKQELMCGAWAANVASLWYILIPPPPAHDQSPAPTPITIHILNTTTVTAADITDIHTRKLYLDQPQYEGAMHPFDGWVAQYGLTTPLAYTLYYISKIPSWAFMISLSLFSRYFVSKRMPPAAPRAAPGGAAPASAPAAAAR